MISFVNSIIHSQNEQCNIHIQRQFNNQMLIRLLFFQKLHFPQVDLRILFFLLFFQESSAGKF